MANLKDLCQKYFGTSNPYEVFGIEKTASETEIRKAYHRLSLKLHPDRANENKIITTEKFKVVNLIHSVLSNKSKRDLYDTTGLFSNEHIDFGDIESFKNYWKSLFKEVTTVSVDEYEKKYKGSEEETNDLKRVYLSSKGDMNIILETVLFGHPSEEERYYKIIESLIRKGDIRKYEKFFAESSCDKIKRKLKYDKEAKAAEKKAKTLIKAGSNTEELTKMILQNQIKRDNSADIFFENLQKKYCNENKKSAKRTCKR